VPTLVSPTAACLATTSVATASVATASVAAASPAASQPPSSAARSRVRVRISVRARVRVSVRVQVTVGVRVRVRVRVRHLRTTAAVRTTPVARGHGGGHRRGHRGVRPDPAGGSQRTGATAPGGRIAQGSAAATSAAGLGCRSHPRAGAQAARAADEPRCDTRARRRRRRGAPNDGVSSSGAPSGGRRAGWRRSRLGQRAMPG